MSSKDDRPGFSANDKGSREDIRRPGRLKKREFHGNQWTDESTRPTEPETQTSTSQRKPRDSDSFKLSMTDNLCYVLEFLVCSVS